MKLRGRRQKRPPLVAILGSGPAGLFAAQAVYDMGGVVNIYARNIKSTMYGAQYLHAPIPGLSTLQNRETVNYILKGTVEGYRRKVYGDGLDIEVSPQTLAGAHDAWDIREAYDNAWERFAPLIRPTDIKPLWLDTTARAEMFDLVVWAIPLMPQCVGAHGFLGQTVWAQGDAPDLERYCSVTVEPWTVVTNGEDAPSWYRASNVFGHRTCEWPGARRPPVEGIARVVKPINNRCDCWPELGGAPVLRVGRYGTWTKGELSHEGYFKTRSTLVKMGYES